MNKEIKDGKLVKSENKCDICGEVFAGLAYKVINTNFEIQRGLIQCTNCFEKELKITEEERNDCCE